MKAAIMQPIYLPWIGYFDLIDQVDHFVFLDTVQFSKQSWQQRNRIKTHQGVLMLTVPVKQDQNQLVEQVEIDNRNRWANKHWRSIKASYEKSPYWNFVKEPLAEIYERSWTKLCDLNICLIQTLMSILDIHTPTHRASMLVRETEDRGERLTNICETLQCKHYLSPVGAQDYLAVEKPVFDHYGIAVEFQNFQHPIYRQAYGDFVTKLSVLDFICNVGTGALSLMRSVNGRAHRAVTEHR